MLPILLALTLIMSGEAYGQTLTLSGGELVESGTKQTAPVWAFEYQQPLNENFAASFSWLNEGHVTDHHRDGQSAEIWSRVNILDRRLSLSAGAGPYRFYDTTGSKNGAGYEDIHGWGIVSGVALTYYTDSRWTYDLRWTRIIANNSINTSTLMFGIGYQLEPISEPGPEATSPTQIGKTTNDEITIFSGKTIINSFHSELSSTRAFEYRHGLFRYVDVTIGEINEQNPKLAGRNEITAQIWAVREVLASNRLRLGIGYGPYAVVDKYRTPSQGDPNYSRFSWIFTATAAYKFSEHWDARFSWNRQVTDFNRDADVILFGAGYRY